MQNNLAAEIFGRVFIHYNKRVYPRIKEYKGTTRLNNFLCGLADRSIPDAGSEASSIASGDWDNLIILDACRHDIFEEVLGKSPFRFSKASSSGGYIKENFSSGDWSDVIYVSANPHTHPRIFEDLTGRDIDETFFEVFQVYETNWDEDYNTVMPEDMCQVAKTAKKLFPEKKLIIHFMQPHYPFINSSVSEEGFQDIFSDEVGEDVWTKMVKGKADSDRVIECYKENLEKVWNSLEPLLDELTGVSVVTADHGNFLGEYGLYGHPEGINAEAVRKVPFVKI